MRAQCCLCGLLVGAEAVDAASAEEFAAAGFACFLHLLQQHPEHIQSAINPLVGQVANYISTLAFEGTEAWEAERRKSLQAVLDLLPRVYWDAIQKRFAAREPHTLLHTPKEEDCDCN
ncbi:MAG: hypothetical protein KatS3mg005_4167 [Bryobacteraceae bacterium]|nr:MAG: hypothetical protein KatS3mg005_4167 [Bryobacteraceae bacterium]